MKQYIGGTKKEQKDEHSKHLTMQDVCDAINIQLSAGVYNVHSTITINPYTTISGTFTTSYVDPSIFTTFQKPNPKYIGGYKIQQ
jgi:hypothetical protein